MAMNNADSNYTVDRVSSPVIKTSKSATGKGLIKDEDEWIVDFQNRERFLSGQLEVPFRNMVRWQRLYLAERDDLRTEDEIWRSNVFVPYPYSGIDTKSSALMDILNSEPFEEIEGRMEKSEDSARKVDRLADYTLDMNKWRSRFKDIITEGLIQGTSVVYVGHKKQSSMVNLKVTKNQRETFLAAMNAAVAAGCPKPPSPLKDPEAFEIWRQLVNTSQRPGVPPIPPFPTTGKKEVTAYDGPCLERASIFGFRFDPLVDNVQEQPMFMRRFVKTQAWVMAQVEAGVFDKEAVESAMTGTGDRRMETWESEIADMLGIHQQHERDPYFKDAHEVYEVYEPEDEDNPYKVVLNRSAIVNAERSWQFMDGRVPYVPFRPIKINGHFLGMSDLQQQESLYYEMNKLRSLRLDAVTMAALPMLAKAKDNALPELRRKIKPGAVFDESRPNSIRYLVGPTVDAALFREIFEIKNDIDESASTPSQLRGNQAVVGRVSATEAQGRYNASLLRIKQQAIGLEDEFTPALVMGMMRWVEFGGDPINIPVKGTNEGSPFDMLAVSREDILKAIGSDWRFRGATRTLDKDKQLGQMFQFAGTLGQNLMPSEMRAVMKRIWYTMGLRGADQVITEKGTKIAQTMWEAKMTGAAGAEGQPTPVPSGGSPSIPPPGAGSDVPMPPDAQAAATGQPVDASADLVNQIGQGNSLSSTGFVS